MTLAFQATGIHDYTGFKHSVKPIPAEWEQAYIPPQYVGRPLPAGAFRSLWPDSRGFQWAKIKPADYGPEWRPPYWEYRPELYD
jgi:hypothetical protein